MSHTDFLKVKRLDDLLVSRIIKSSKKMQMTRGEVNMRGASYYIPYEEASHQASTLSFLFLPFDLASPPQDSMCSLKPELCPWMEKNEEDDEGEEKQKRAREKEGQAEELFK